MNIEHIPTYSIMPSFSATASDNTSLFGFSGNVFFNVSGSHMKIKPWNVDDVLDALNIRAL